MFAETLVDNSKTAEAFEMTRDLLDNYGEEEDSVLDVVESDSAKLIKESQIQRDEFTSDVGLDGLFDGVD